MYIYIYIHTELYLYMTVSGNILSPYKPELTLTCCIGAL